MPYFSFKVLDPLSRQELSVLRNVLEAPDATHALAEARHLYPGKTIVDLHFMDADHGQREVEATRWMEALPQPLQFLVALFVVIMFAIGVWLHDWRKEDVGH